MILRSGIDLVDIQRLEDINPAIRRRFIERIFNAQERFDLGDSSERLAGGFAVKEAVVKTLGCGIGAVSWHEMIIHHNAAGAPELELNGRAAAIAAGLGLDQWSISISHSRTHAIALAVAVGSAPSPEHPDVQAVETP